MTCLGPAGHWLQPGARWALAAPRLDCGLRDDRLGTGPVQASASRAGNAAPRDTADVAKARPPKQGRGTCGSEFPALRTRAHIGFYKTARPDTEGRDREALHHTFSSFQGRQ